MSKKNEALKIAIVGSGFGLYGQLPAFNSLKECKVVAICGKKTPRLLGYCNSVGLKNIYTDWREMLKKEELDAVAIAVVPVVQYQIASAAIKKGLHVFAEKPLAVNLVQAKKLYSLAKQKKVKTAVDFIFPEIEEWQKVKQLLDSRAYGKLKDISASWDFLSYDIRNKLASWKTDSKKGGGAAAFYFSHILYYLEFFAGPISKIESRLTFSKESKNGGETGVDAQLRFKNKVLGSAHLSCNNTKINKHEIIFTCEKASIVLEADGGVTKGFKIRVVTKRGEKFVKVKLNKETKKQDERVTEVRKIAKRFLAGIKGKKQIIPSFKEGVRVQELVEKIKSK